MLIDDVEQSLHPGAQVGFMTLLKQLIATAKIQVLMTTHSPDVLDQLEPGQVWVLGLDAEGATVNEAAERPSLGSSCAQSVDHRRILVGRREMLGFSKQQLQPRLTAESLVPHEFRRFHRCCRLGARVHGCRSAPMPEDQYCNRLSKFYADFKTCFRQIQARTCWPVLLPLPCRQPDCHGLVGQARQDSCLLKCEFRFVKSGVICHAATFT